MQIIRPNIDIAEACSLRVGDTFEFTVESARFGVCIVTSLEEAIDEGNLENAKLECGDVGNFAAFINDRL